MHEHAEEIRDASLSHADANVRREAFAVAVKVGQKADAAEVEAMNCRRQLSWLQVGAMIEDVAVGVEVALVFLYSSKTTSDPIPGQTMTSTCRMERSRDIDPS
jgi:hypothetical protein